ncbi:hypothetical protein HC752_06420 [Vibrio sp. S9_S30]|uniref:zinc-dependent metalloprotease n=1 Tax=Vibrio sp. S9_S30 TaxID=2720226 RepID=UPI0016814159|nr:zinc-dependent metalloprotease [Vibrio sp. S9_S30]MBD1556566.1 hypothetical protein [Vibrio sp. S9_S30]
MNFKKLSLVTAVGAALVGCGADDQAYDYVDKDINQSALSSLTGSAPVKVGSCADCYEIPLEGIWMFQQTFGDVTRTSDVHPYMYDFLNSEKLVKLKFTEDGLVAEKLEGDITFEGEVTRFPGSHNEPRLLTLEGSYEAYQCKEDSYGDCTNKEEKVSDPAIRWWQKTHFTPEYDKLTVHDDQTIFEAYFDNLINKNVTHVDFDPKNGVINIEFEHNTVGDGFYGEPEKNTVFYSLVRLDTVASQDYTPVHYDLPEHDKFGMFKTPYEKLDPNYIQNQIGYEGYFLNRFNPEKEQIEYYLSDEFFVKDESGNLAYQQWLDATVRGFELINKSLEDKFSPNGRIVPKLVLVNANDTTPSGVHVGDLRKNVVHIVPEASDGGGGGLGPSYANPLTGEILNAYTIMFPGNLMMSTNRHWDTLVKHYNKGTLEPENTDSSTDDAGVVSEGAGFKASTQSLELAVQVNDGAISREKAFDEVSSSVFTYEYSDEESIDLQQVKSEEETKLEKMIENNIYPIDLYSVSSAVKKSNITELDFFNQGFYFEQTEDEINSGVKPVLKSWADLNEAQRNAVTVEISTHYYMNVLVHEIGHNLGLRHNFAGSYDGHNFYTSSELASMGLEGTNATSSIMDYNPSALNTQPAFGHYDRAALRFAYQRKVESHDIVDEEVLSDTEVATALRTYRQPDAVSFVDLTHNDSEKRENLKLQSGLSKLLHSTELADSGQELRDYAYCTDGKGRRPSETGCLIFDEGSSLTQVTDYHAEQFEDRFDVYSERQERVEFNENRRYIFKFLNLHRSFAKMNMVLDDYYQEFRSNPVLPSSVCPDNIANLSVVEQKKCDAAQAAYKQAYFYLDVLRAPEKSCQVELVEYKWNDTDSKFEQSYAGDTYYGLSTMNYLAGVIGGQSYTGQMKLPTSCFDTNLGEALASGVQNWTNPSTGVRYQISYRIKGESTHGEFFNKVRLSQRASSERASSIGYEVDHLGSWMDKLVALEYLVQPSGLRGVDFALVDLPGVREELTALVDHWNLNTPLPTNSALTNEFSNVLNPYEIVNASGNPVAARWSPRWKTKEIWSTPSRLAWVLNYFYGTNLNAGTPFPKVMNSVLAKYDSSRTDSYKPEAYAMRAKVAVYDYNGHIPNGFEGIEILGRTYAVDTREDSISLGKTMLNSVNDSDVFKFGQFTSAQLAEYVERKGGIVDVAVGTSARGDDLRASTNVQTLHNLGLGIDKFANAMLSNLNNEKLFLTVGELNATIDALVVSGDATDNGECINLEGFGCLRNSQGQFHRPAINAGVAFKSIWIADVELANETVQYLTRYTSELSRLSSTYGSLFGTSDKELQEYIASPLQRESMRLKAIDSAGLRNLIIIDENDRVSNF